MRLLLVDDDDMLRSTVVPELRREGYAVDTSPTLAQALWSIETNAYDLLIVDWNLPDGEGIHIVENLRSLGRSPLVLMLTVRADEDSRVAGLDAGGDDYMSKPFGVRELKARIRALLRRLPQPAIGSIQVGGLHSDRDRREVLCGGDRVLLTAKEFSVVEYLALNAGRLVTFEELVRHIWDENHDPASHALEVHVSKIRSKLGVVGHTLLRTRRGLGYMLSVENPDDSATSNRRG